jgi:hypothetical protein
MALKSVIIIIIAYKKLPKYQQNIWEKIPFTCLNVAARNILTSKLVSWKSKQCI